VIERERAKLYWEKYYVFVEPEALKSDWSRDRIMTALMAEGIPCGSGSCSEIYLEKAFGNRRTAPLFLKNSLHQGFTCCIFTTANYVVKR